MWHYMARIRDRRVRDGVVIYWSQILFYTIPGKHYSFVKKVCASSYCAWKKGACRGVGRSNLNRVGVFFTGYRSETGVRNHHVHIQ